MMGKRGSQPMVAPEERYAMLARHLKGETLQAIGDSYDISRERVRQLISCEGGYCSNKKKEESIKRLILTLFKPGMTKRELIDLSGLTGYAFNKTTRALNLQFAPPPYKGIVADDEMIQAYSELKSIAKVASLFKIKQQFCYRRLRAAGVDTRQGVAKARKRFDTPKGEMTIKEISQLTGATRGAIKRRIQRGLPLLTPVPQTKRYRTPKGMLTVKEMASFSGLTVAGIRYRLKMGCPPYLLLLPPKSWRPWRRPK